MDNESEAANAGLGDVATGMLVAAVVAILAVPSHALPWWLLGALVAAGGGVGWALKRWG